MIPRPAPAIARSALVFLVLSGGSSFAGTHAARAQTKLFIRNHVNSDQIGGLAEWKGALVAATLGGLLFTNPTNNEVTKLLSASGGLPSNRLFCVAVSPSGELWAGTTDKGLARLKPDGGFRRTLTTFDGLPSDRVQALYVRGDSVWVGTSGGVALFTQSPASGQIALRRSDSSASTGGALVSDNVLSFAQVGDTLWCGTGGGVSTFANGTWQNRALALSQAARALAVYQDTLWAATAAGPQKYSSGVFTPAALGHTGGSRTVYADGTRLLSGSQVEGAFRYAGGPWSAFGAAPPGGFHPQAFLTLAGGALWAGTDQGLARYDASGDQWTRVRSEGPAVNGTQRAVADDRGVWFATGNFLPAGGTLGNVLFYDGRTWSNVSNLSTGGSLQAASVFGLLSDRARTLWIGHCCGAGDPKPRTERWDPATDVWDALGVTNLFVLAQAPSGLVFGGSVEHGNGVYVFDPATTALIDSLTPANTQGATGAGLASNNLRGISFDTTGRGWFSHAASGVDIWNGRGTLTDHLDDVWIRLSSGLPSLQTSDVVTTGASSGWVGTSAGVARIENDKVEPVTTARVNEDLPSPEVRDLALDSAGNLWIATGAGLARVDAATGTVERWSTADGLAGDDVRDLAWDARRSNLWVGTTDGISEVLPSSGEGSAFGDGSYVYPSPIDDSSGPLRLGGITDAVEGEIRDVTGALVSRFHCDPIRNEIWDLKLPNGVRAASGVYLVLLRDGSRSKVLRVAVIR